MAAESPDTGRNTPRPSTDTGETADGRTGPRIGSLFSGAGGLDMAVQAVFGGQVVWHSEIDPAASKVLAHHWPEVPNLGDISAVDWSTVEPVDILCGGFPCQDVSAAGKRAGIKNGTRSGLWVVFAEAIDQLRPPIVVIENVRGLLSATAHRTENDEQPSDMEPATAAMGNGTGRPVLRAAGAVLGDLCDLGYDAQWATVAASSVGAPHRRERVFILAADTNQVRSEGCGLSNGVGAAQPKSGGSQLSLCAQCGHEQRLHCDWIGRCTKPCECPAWFTPDTSGNGWDEGRPESARQQRGFDAAVSGDEPGVALLPTPRASDPANASSHSSEGFRPQLGEVVRQLGGAADDGVALLPTPNASDATGGGAHPDKRKGHSRQLIDYALLDGTSQWGKYAPAIYRWRCVIDRVAPPPTELNKNGNPRLAAPFSEWMMGWPAGHVTDPAIGISRNDQLRIIGNGVVPQQAAHALRFLLAVAAGTHTHTPRAVADVTLLPTPTTQDGANCGGPSQFKRNTLPLNTEVLLLPKNGATG